MLEKLFDELCLRRTGYLEALEESYGDSKSIEKYKLKIEELDDVIRIVLDFMR